MQLARTLTGFVALYLFFWSITHTTLAKAILLNSSAPLYVPIIAFIFYKSRISPVVVASICLGFAGIVLILRPDAKSVRLGDIAALTSGILAAFSIIFIRILRRKGEERTITIVLYYALTIMILSFLCSLPHIEFPTGNPLLFVICSAVCFVLFQMFFTSSFKYAPAAKISPLIYFGVIFGALIDACVWNNKLGYLAVLGAVFVIAGSVISMLQTEDDVYMIG